MYRRCLPLEAKETGGRPPHINGSQAKPHIGSAHVDYFAA